MNHIMNVKNIIKLLIIEDNQADYRIIEELLKETEFSEFNITHRTKLEDGLKQLEHTNFDIVLLDLNLPDSNGLNTFHKILSKRPELPIIILTGLSDEEMGVNMIKQGAQDYLVKGEFTGKNLVRSIHYAIERKKLEGLFSYYIPR